MMELQTLSTAPASPEANVSDAKSESHALTNLASVDALAAVSLALAGCSGGSGGGSGNEDTPDDLALPTQAQSARFLSQAGLGANSAAVAALNGTGYASWFDTQTAMPVTDSRFDWLLAKGYGKAADRTNFVGADNMIWRKLIASPDVLRQRVVLALSEIFVVSMEGLTGAWAKFALAAYLDMLETHAFGTFRQLLQGVTLSCAMGMYLNMRGNRKGDAKTGRQPDENYAREVMQLFTIGLHELNLDGTPVLGADGQPIETYSNTDVMALARALTGWSWAFADTHLTEQTFRFATPDIRSAAADQRIDLLPMKAYPGLHSTGEKRLFNGKPWAAVLPAGQTAQSDLNLVLDTLFNHPNVGPFIGRQLIQRLVTSHPSPAYVARVASVFNNNGAGVRGDLAAVVRAILLDAEAVAPPIGATGKLREPVLALAQWLRATAARSSSGEYLLSFDLDASSQRAWSAPTVFGYFRPGYVPPNSSFANNNTTVPELQLANESTTTRWVNMAMNMAGPGLGWNNTAFDVQADLQPLIDLSMAGRVDAMVEHLNLLLHAGRMSPALKTDITDAVTTVFGIDAASHANRARVALFLALAAPEYLIQR